MAAQRRASESPVVFKEMIARKKSANLAVFATQITATASSEFLGIDETQTCEEIEQILDEAELSRAFEWISVEEEDEEDDTTARVSREPSLAPSAFDDMPCPPPFVATAAPMQQTPAKKLPEFKRGVSLPACVGAGDVASCREDEDILAARASEPAGRRGRGVFTSVMAAASSYFGSRKRSRRVQPQADFTALEGIVPQTGGDYQEASTVRRQQQRATGKAGAWSLPSGRWNNRAGRQ